VGGLLAESYPEKTRDTIDVLIDVEQIWRETVPPRHELSAEQKKKLLELLQKAQKNVEQVLELVEGKKE
jgi:hypothetical protein